VRHLIAKNELLYSRQQLFETTAKAAFYKNLIFLKKLFSLIFLCCLKIIFLKNKKILFYIFINKKYFKNNNYKFV
jgi:hypothetical protein